MNGLPSSTAPQCLLVADDLTGACDAAVHFAASGARTIVAVSSAGVDRAAEVLAFSTGSRDVAPAESARLIAAAAARLCPLRPNLVFKKIDSTLRGNTGAEIVAALREFGCDAAVVNPAFPAQGRVVETGVLRVAGDAAFRPVEIAAWLRANGAADCRHIRPGQISNAIAQGARFLSLDAVCDGDLAGIAAEILATPRRILWAGSGGLAAALARCLPPPAPAAPDPLKQTGPVLYCLGSDHPVTLEQKSRLLQAREVRLLRAGTASAAEVRAALELGNHVALRIPRGQVAMENLRCLLSACRPAPFFISGGDTAALVCQALGVNAIEMSRELAPGIPMGILRGGVADNSTVVTKSGGFGSPHDLVRIGDYFRA